MTDQKSLLEFLHGLNAILWESDAPTQQFTFVSQGAEKALGYPVHQWLREPDSWIQHDPSRRPRVRHNLLLSSRGGRER